MIKFVNKKGFTVYKITARETMHFGGIGICDDCNSFSKNGFLVPVLNHYMCESCYRDWVSSSSYFDLESERFENYYIKFFESILPFRVSKCEL